MLNGINLKEEMNNAQLEQQLGISSVATNPINNPYRNIDRNLLIDETAISDEAVNLYEREQDIKQFNALAMSNPEDLSHEEIVANLFNKGISDVFSDETLSEVADNKNLMYDLDIEF